MADTAENLITFLLADSSISTDVGAERIGQSRAQQDWTTPYIVVYRSGSENLLTLDVAAGEKPWLTYFDIECVSDDIDEAADLAELVLAYANGFKGTFGGTTVQLVELAEHDDDYEPRTPNADDAVHVSSVRAELVGVA